MSSRLSNPRELKHLRIMTARCHTWQEGYKTPRIRSCLIRRVFVFDPNRYIQLRSTYIQAALIKVCLMLIKSIAVELIIPTKLISEMIVASTFTKVNSPPLPINCQAIEKTMAPMLNYICAFNPIKAKFTNKKIIEFHKIISSTKGITTTANWVTPNFNKTKGIIRKYKINHYKPRNHTIFKPTNFNYYNSLKKKRQARNLLSR